MVCKMDPFAFFILRITDLVTHFKVVFIIEVMMASNQHSNKDLVNYNSFSYFRAHNRY